MPSPPSPWSSRHHERAEKHGPASGSNVGDEQLQTLRRNTSDTSGRKLNPRTIPDNTLADGIPASIAGVGLALSSYPVAVERSFVTRAQVSVKPAWLQNERLRVTSRSKR